MYTDSYYNLEFLFDRNSDGLDHLFPSMELLIRSFENIDKCLVEAVGYTLEYKRYLRNIGEESFTFSIRVRLFQPRQISLGEDFPSESVLKWMQEGRQIFIEAANSAEGESSANTADIPVRLNKLIDSHGLSHTIMFKTPGESDISALAEDLINAVLFLGGKVKIN
jgi:hypothetical protein